MTLKKIILHAGLPETGTSALQELLADNRTSLAQNGFWYPHVSNPIPHPNHRYLIEELRNSPELSKTQAALDDAAKRDCHTVIFSIEGLSGHVTKIREDAAARLNTLSKGAKIEIVVVLREPDRWLVSMYRQDYVFLRALVSAEIDDRHAELARYKLPAYWKLLGNVVAAQRILGRVHYQPNPPLKVDEKSFADACERMVKRARKALFRKFAWAKR